MIEKLIKRLDRYVRIETTSSAANKKNNPEQCPSTESQWDLANMLLNELSDLGLEAEIDGNAYVMAALPSNVSFDVPAIGYISHIDTSEDFNGKNVNPVLHRNYDGKDIALNHDESMILSVREYPYLQQQVGKTIITTDGTSLLGADDKAGIAIIMTFLEYLLNKPEIPHGDIKICFNPDEEIGKGAELFDVEKFGAQWAYTIDGGYLGDLKFENFNAATATITFTGKAVHPGYAKGKMVNANLLAVEFSEKYMPKMLTPAMTQGYQGFYHLFETQGSTAKSVLKYLIREHDSKKFQDMKEHLEKLVIHFNKSRTDCAVVEIEDSYRNMREKIEPVMHVVDIAQQAMISLNIQPKMNPIRGGTDGSKLSFMGLPCPNLFNGSGGWHGPYEHVIIEEMEQAVHTLVKIAEFTAERHKK